MKEKKPLCLVGGDRFSGFGLVGFWGFVLGVFVGGDLFPYLLLGVFFFLTESGHCRKIDN